MRKLLFYTTLALLVALSGCTEFSSSGTGAEDLAVELETVARGDVVQPGGSIELEYSFLETGEIVNILNIVLTGPDSEVIEEIQIEEEPLPGWAEPIELPEDADEGLYSLRFDFYSDEELFYTEEREFFVSVPMGGIRRIESYPPVLYPGGGGLFNAEIDCSMDKCWLRWSLDDEVISAGAAADGFESIEIVAPDEEGVYELKLEVFPFQPQDEEDYDFESGIIREIPLYVNREQKSGVNEFESAEDFHSLFHFRGNLINSADTGLTGVEELIPSGRPVLSVRSGTFGYYLDSFSAFEADSFMLPVSDGVLQSFSLMMSMIPFGLESSGEESAELFYTESLDGTSFFAGLFPDGRITAELKTEDGVFEFTSPEPVVFENIYTSTALSVQIEESGLTVTLYVDGILLAESVYYFDNDTALMINSGNEELSGFTRLGTEVEMLLDEAGVYYSQKLGGAVIDPLQFRRAMEMEYGKFLMYAEGFDGDISELIVSSAETRIENSSLIIPPLSDVEFPFLYPGYEELEFRIVTGGLAEGDAEAVFFVDGFQDDIAEVDFGSIIESNGLVSFSLIFLKDSVNLAGSGDEAVFAGDFSGVGYRIRNNSPETVIEIKSILVIRKNISVSDNSAESDFPVKQQTQDNIRS
ncbi:MAG: hypothetical protein PQJ61_16515 [Spirochaetales bacterium]|uniref:Uncharacterized protein n=1 Tax=Candidatus Thalassospirochaeta sargassi TaxID=3119039 RepID=A0AAJ1II75_9SPIO|nr:hypothetical protein [Spirochaetales bacterium]